MKRGTTAGCFLQQLLLSLNLLPSRRFHLALPSGFFLWNCPSLLVCRDARHSSLQPPTKVTFSIHSVDVKISSGFPTRRRTLGSPNCTPQSKTNVRCMRDLRNSHSLADQPEELKHKSGLKRKACEASSLKTFSFLDPECLEAGA